MRAIFKMTRLDFFTLKDNWIGVFLLSPLMILLQFFISKGSSSMLPYLISLCLAVLVCLYISFFQEKNSLERLYSSLPVNLKNIVAGRYIFLLLCFAFYTTTTIVLQCGYFIFISNPIKLQEILIIVTLAFFAFSIVVGISLLLCFKMSFLKVKIFSLISWYGFLVIMGFLKSTDVITSICEFIMANEGLVIVSCIIGGCFLYYLSYSIAVITYRKR